MRKLESYGRKLESGLLEIELARLERIGAADNWISSSRYSNGRDEVSRDGRKCAKLCFRREESSEGMIRKAVKYLLTLT